MDRLHAIEVFAAVAAAGSFAKVARAMRLSPPAVTRAITSLETRLGARLLLRTTRSVRLTESGHRFLSDCQRILQDLQEAEEAATGSFTAPRGVLNVTASALFGRYFVAQILCDFVDKYPGVLANALFVDRLVHMLEEGIDVAVRIGPLPDSSLTAIKVGSVRRVVCAAPSYLEQHGLPQHPAELSSRRVIGAGSLTSTMEWVFGEKSNTLRVQLQPAITFNTVDAAIESAAGGWGLTRVLSYQIAPYLMDGRLQTVMREYEPDPWPVHVLHHEGRKASAKVRAFVDFTVAALRANRAINPGA